jgi:hypothetical protein
MILSAAAPKSSDLYSQLVWQPIDMLKSKAIINARHYVIRYKIGSAAPGFNVFQDNAAMPFNTALTEQVFKQRLNAGAYAPVIQPPVYVPPPVIPPVDPVNDPTGPESENGSGGLFGSSNIYYYAAAAIIAAGLYFKYKK